VAAAAMAEGARRITMNCNIQAIKAAMQMEEYASRYVDFKRGAAMCPFHAEKTASFRVKGEFFKCFGCGVGGDVITFAARYHDISVRQAIQLLANEAGVALSGISKANKYDRAKEQRIAAEADEWRNQVRKRAKNWPATDLLRAMPRRELIEEYKSHRTKQLGEEMREIMRDHDQWVKTITPLIKGIIAL
jgi:DNA primase